jgi:hypothetical protein
MPTWGIGLVPAARSTSAKRALLWPVVGAAGAPPAGAARGHLVMHVVRDVCRRQQPPSPRLSPPPPSQRRRQRADARDLFVPTYCFATGKSSAVALVSNRSAFFGGLFRHRVRRTRVRLREGSIEGLVMAGAQLPADLVANLENNDDNDADADDDDADDGDTSATATDDNEKEGAATKDIGGQWLAQGKQERRRRQCFGTFERPAGGRRTKQDEEDRNHRDSNAAP